MQIHEITFGKKLQIDEGVFDTLGQGVGKAVSSLKNVGSAVSAPFKDVAGGYKSGRQDQQIAATADKAYRAWSGYAQQLRKSVADRGDTKALAAFDQRKDPLYKKSLLAFVQKNLLGNISLANATNQADIMNIVNALSAPVTTPATKTPAPTAPTPAGTTTKPATPQYGKNLGSTATYNQPMGVPSTASTVPPGVSQVSKATVTPTPAGKETVSVGGQKLNPKDPKQAELIKKAQAAAAKTPVTETLDPETEKKLFVQLVRAAAMASTEADTTKQQSLGPDQIRSTGNKEADKLLVKQGYKLQP